MAKDATMGTLYGSCNPSRLMVGSREGLVLEILYVSKYHLDDKAPSIDTCIVYGALYGS